MGRGGSQQSTVGRTHPKPSTEACAPQLLQEQDPLLPTQTPEQFPVFWDSLSFEVASPALHSRWETCPARAQQLLHTRSEAELGPAERPDPCTDPTEPPELLLPSRSQCSVGLCGILNVCKKSQVLLLCKETKHSLLLPLHF